MKLAGSYVGSGAARIQLPIRNDPSNEEIDAALQVVAAMSGIVCLSAEPVPAVGAYELVLYADDGAFMLMLSRYTEDGDHEVDTITDARAGAGENEIFGDLYQRRMTTRDIEPVRRCFHEFASTRNVQSASLKLDERGGTTACVWT